MNEALGFLIEKNLRPSHNSSLFSVPSYRGLNPQLAAYKNEVIENCSSKLLDISKFHQRTVMIDWVRIALLFHSANKPSVTRNNKGLLRATESQGGRMIPSTCGEEGAQAQRM